jgi:AcrR family transcriptional regulator
MSARQARGTAVHERLLDAAESLFYTHGITGTGVDAVLREAGVSTATLYAHFGGKDALVAGYLQRRLDRWRRLWDEAVADASTPEDRLLAVFDALGRYRADQPPGRGCAMLAAAVEIPGPGHPAYDVIASDTAYLRDRLRALAADLSVDDPDELAEQVLLLYDGTLSAYLRGAWGDPLARGRALAATAVETALRAVPCPETPGGRSKDRSIGSARR